MENQAVVLDDASRGDRLGSMIIDSIILSVISLIVILSIVYLTGGFDRLQHSPPVEMPLYYTFGILLFNIAIYAAVNWKLLGEEGQTIGKKFNKIRIVNLDGSQPTRNEILLKRYTPYVMIPLIPLIGGLISLVGTFMIFGKQRRCLHDRIAGTRVVNVQADAEGDSQ
jgi:uncharacterized RDD family membrane protein YckC